VLAVVAVVVVVAVEVSVVVNVPEQRYRQVEPDCVAGPLAKANRTMSNDVS
jgi:hypothetical protein